MKDLQEEQRKMRERIRATKPTKAPVVSRPFVEPSETKNPQKLLKQIKILEAENASLRRQLSELREQPRLEKRSPQMSDSERRHLFMKYSNVRRY